MARRKDPLVWGIILIAIGVIFILENFNIDVWDSVWKLWPLVLILWGASKLYYGFQERKERAERPAAKPQDASFPQDRP
jgi:uncharacterized membrane protein HdeD (DUF308 family)